MIIEDPGIISELFSLLDDDVIVRLPLRATNLAMEELRDMTVELALSKKVDGLIISLV